MSLDLQKNIVLVGIGACVVLLLIVRAAEGPQTESETPPMPASEEGASPQSPSSAPGAEGDPSDASDPDAPRAEDGTEMAVVEELGIASDMEHPFMEGVRLQRVLGPLVQPAPGRPAGGHLSHLVQ
jgi:hypothetical protein